MNVPDFDSRMKELDDLNKQCETSSAMLTKLGIKRKTPDETHFDLPPALSAPAPSPVSNNGKVKLWRTITRLLRRGPR